MDFESSGQIKDRAGVKGIILDMSYLGSTNPNCIIRVLATITNETSNIFTIFLNEDLFHLHIVVQMEKNQ